MNDNCCIFTAEFTETEALDAEFEESENLAATFGETSFIHTDNYNDLTHKPTINAVTVIGDKLGADYHLQDKMDTITDQMIDDIIYGV